MSDSAVPWPLGPSVLLDHVRLTQSGHDVLVHVPPYMDTPPFPLPPMCTSFVDWLTMVGLRFLREHDRCLGMLLIRDFKAEKWVVVIPRQRVTPDSASWHPAKKDFPWLTPTSVVLGSFQIRRLEIGEDPIDTLPFPDGLHFIVNARERPHVTHTYVRIDGVARQVKPHEIIVDDLQQMLDDAAPRIQY